MNILGFFPSGGALFDQLEFAVWRIKELLQTVLLLKATLLFEALESKFGDSNRFTGLNTLVFLSHRS